MSLQQPRRYTIEEHVVAGKRLGRHVNHDPRSAQFPARRANAIVDVSHRAVGLPLDQGDVGSCTGNALVAKMNSAPAFRPGGKIRTEQDALEVYGVETAIEGEPYPPNDPGGSGLAVCQAGVQLKWLSGYRHAFGLQHALLALVERPVITGVNWYDSFDQPASNGTIMLSPDAQVRGGHEFCVDGIVVERKLVACWQSWGPDYGLGGRFFMSWAVWERLLGEDGDVTVPIAMG